MKKRTLDLVREVNNSITIITGYTGSGKTTLAKHLFNSFNRSIVYKVNVDDDYQGVYIYDNYSLTEYLSNNYDKDKLKIVYDNELKDNEDFENFCYIVYKFRNILVVFEEINIYASSYYCPPELKVLINTGRHYNITQIFLSQRINKIAGEILSQAKHIITFNQTHHRDLLILSEFFDEDEVKSLDKYEFLYWERFSENNLKCQLVNDKVIVL